MPYKAKKPCARTGCANLTHGRYCADHARAEKREYNQYRRDPGTNKRYGRSWKKIRLAFLSANPLCERCGNNGKFTAATTVHHKQKLSEDGTNEESNLMSLCASCHSVVHAVGQS